MNRSNRVLLVLLLATACGDDDRPVGDGGPDRDGGAREDAGRISDDGGSGTDGGPGSDGGPAGGGYQGTVSLTHANITGEQTILGGFLTDSPDIRMGALPGCTVVRTVGPCVQATCPGLEPSLDGGILTAAVGGTTVATSPATTGGYFGMVPGRVFDPGDVVTLSTTGGAVPAFSGDVTAPEALTTTLPTAFTPGAPLTFSWDGAVEADEVELGLSSVSGAVVCSVTASVGTLTIDGAITGDLSGAVPVTIKSLDITPVTAGEYRIAVIAADSISGTITAE